MNSAVTFLKDPAVANAPIEQRSEFLKSKGLNADEIAEAFRRSSLESSKAQRGTTESNTPVELGRTVMPPNSFSPYQTRVLPPPQLPPPIPRRDWKDYFIMATVSVGVAYALYEVGKRYLLPAIMPPSPAELEAAKSALEAEFQRTEAIVEQLQKDMEHVMNVDAERDAQFEQVIQDARSAIDSVTMQTSQRREEMTLLKSHVETLRDMLPKALEKHCETQNQAILELQDEIKSLKQLVQSRMRSTTPAVPPASAVVTDVASIRQQMAQVSTDGINGTKNYSTSHVGSSVTAQESMQPDEPFIPTPAGATSSPFSMAPATSPEEFAAPVSAGIPSWQLSNGGST